MNVVEIKMALIDEDKDQPRYQFNEEALQELMNSIEELGLLSPIKVRPEAGGRYKIIYGNRRYKACQMLGREAIPCIISSATDEMEIYLEQIAENLTREGFSPIEEAEAFHKLLNDERFRSSTKFLSAKLGKPESYIKNKLELLKFSNAVKKLIVSGTEIRKDQLTEDQLIPLKDLPMEHRDPLALIAARDELAVSDVKKIAKLFKDKTISDNTKEKLLLKNGDGLIETWSVYEQNRKERAKAQKEQEEAAARKAELAAEARASSDISSAASSNARGNSGGVAVPGGGMAVSDSGSHGAGGAGASNASGAASGIAVGSGSLNSDVSSPAIGSATNNTSGGAAQQTRSSVSALMRQLQEMLPRQNELSSTIYRLAASLQEEAEALSAEEIDHTIGMLQQQLAQWQELRGKLSN
ncbi:chromosome partitioning protein ParB [Paenibacillus oryzae]|uniref:Chromosome partitioning protein ParB n=1 Tax=Paenibacillus oryzae TaxID=1844972 RepID=A0A1A5YR13_9BACL|nr:ParB/RepB/Spo0J family partition protein [Paenibacillus oryzae]OBR68004.1 chromosome partitioning protein ParB [Paenibacillus oryzae]